MIDRRTVAGGLAVAIASGAIGGPALGALLPDAAGSSYGSVGRIVAQPGQRSALAALMLAGTRAMPGCLTYLVAEDRGEADALWVFEAWASKADHDASLALPAVRETIAKARPLIVGFDRGAELTVLGGLGLGDG